MARRMIAPIAEEMTAPMNPPPSEMPKRGNRKPAMIDPTMPTMMSPMRPKPPPLTTCPAIQPASAPMMSAMMIAVRSIVASKVAYWNNLPEILRSSSTPGEFCPAIQAPAAPSAGIETPVIRRAHQQRDRLPGCAGLCNYGLVQSNHMVTLRLDSAVRTWRKHDRGKAGMRR